MFFRTDLAIEASELQQTNEDGVSMQAEQHGSMKVTRMRVKTKKASERLGKSKGNYITVELPPLTDHFEDTEVYIRQIAREISALLPREGLVLVAGLGNFNITPDDLGPQTARLVLATRHITGEIARSTGLSKMRPVAVLAPGVLGQTGIETGELLYGIVQKVKPAALIVVDALASRRLSRLGCTVQISDTGIAPGSGVHNRRPGIHAETMGIPVISMGVPTVVDAATLAADLLCFEDEKQFDKIKSVVAPRGEAMMVTPREIDLLIEHAAKLVGMAINCALQPEFSLNDLYSLVS